MRPYPFWDPRSGFEGGIKCAVFIWSVVLVATFIFAKVHAADLRIPRLHHHKPLVTSNQSYAPAYFRCMQVHRLDLKKCKGLIP